MTPLLDGLVVTEWSTGLAAAMAGQFLADHGADVVVVDAPGPETLAGNLVAVVHRGKRRVTIDVASAQGREDLRRLVAGSHLFIEDRAPGASLGLDAGTTRAADPQLVHCSITAQGHDARGADQTADDALVLAALGAMTEQSGHREGPIFIAQRMASLGAAHLAVIGSLAALHRRFSGGGGAWVETSLTDGALAQLTLFWARFSRVPTVRVGSASLRLVAASYECSDGEWLGVHTGAVGAHARLMELLGLSDRVPPSTGGLEMGAALTDEQAALLRDELPRIFRTRTRADWTEALLAADICAIPVLRSGEAFDLAQVVHNGMVLDLDDPQLGPIRMAGVPVVSAEGRGSAPHPAPLRGSTAGVERAAAASGAGSGRATPAHRPLDGVRVLDFSQYFAGPYASRFLADLGADVVKVEALSGDPNRANARVFVGGHRGKRSLSIDLKAAPAAEVVRRLFAGADVVTHNMRPGVAERLGIDAASVHAVNPSAVYMYTPGWGSSGPDARRQGFAPLYSGLVGLQFEQAGRGNPPVWPVANEDYVNGLHGAWGILMGLVHRARTGAAATLESPQVSATLTMPVGVLVRRGDGAVLGVTELDPGQHGTSALRRLYRVADGWVCVAADGSAAGAVCSALGVAGAAPDGGAPDGPLAAVLAERLAVIGAAEAVAALRAAGAGAVRVVDADGRARFFDDPEQQRMGRIAHAGYDAWGASDEIAALVRLDGVPAGAELGAPALGGHSAEVLAELGYDDAAIAEMVDTGVVRSAQVIRAGA